MCPKRLAAEYKVFSALITHFSSDLRAHFPFPRKLLKKDQEKGESVKVWMEITQCVMERGRKRGREGERGRGRGSGMER